MKKTSCLIVTFYTATENEINNLLDQHKVSSAVSVSSIIPRWALEVPAWKEKEIIEEFYKNDLVKSVHTYAEKFSRK